MSLTQSIPQPPRIPVIGNLSHLDGAAPVQSMMHLARRYGPIYQLEILKRRVVVLS